MNAEEFKRVSQAFNGFTLDRRGAGTNWPAPWRAQILPTAATRQEYRLTAYGDTAEAAVHRLDALLTEQRAKFQALLDATPAGNWTFVPAKTSA